MAFLDFLKPKGNGKANGTVPGWWQVRSWTDEQLLKAMMPEQFDLRHADPTCIGEDDEGRRFWLFREGLYARETAKPRWFVHGLFA